VNDLHAKRSTFVYELSAPALDLGALARRFLSQISRPVINRISGTNPAKNTIQRPTSPNASPFVLWELPLDKRLS
jgi:hypothetical protein